jgi:hypothetical protein
MELHNRFARLEAEFCHWRSLAQKLLLDNRTVNNQSENFSGNREILNENKKKRHRSSSSSSSFQTLNSAITGNPEVMFSSNWSDEIGLEITEIGKSRSDNDYSTDTVEHSSYRNGENRNYRIIEMLLCALKQVKIRLKRGGGFFPDNAITAKKEIK